HADEAGSYPNIEYVAHEIRRHVLYAPVQRHNARLACCWARICSLLGKLDAGYYRADTGHCNRIFRQYHEAAFPIETVEYCEWTPAGSLDEEPLLERNVRQPLHPEVFDSHATNAYINAEAQRTESIASLSLPLVSSPALKHSIIAVNVEKAHIATRSSGW